MIRNNGKTTMHVFRLKTNQIMEGYLAEACSSDIIAATHAFNQAWLDQCQPYSMSMILVTVSAIFNQLVSVVARVLS